MRQTETRQYRVRDVLDDGQSVPRIVVAVDEEDVGRTPLGNLGRTWIGGRGEGRRV